MEINTNLVGTLLKNFHTEISWRQTTNFAAAIQDNNPKYFDDEKEQGIVSHPMFPCAVTWPVLSQLGEYIEAEDFPKEVLLTQVHLTLTPMSGTLEMVHL